MTKPMQACLNAALRSRLMTWAKVLPEEQFGAVPSAMPTGRP